MSGELRLANSGAAPLVASLAALAEAVPIGEFAVIGGLAVLARLQGPIGSPTTSTPLLRSMVMS